MSEKKFRAWDTQLRSYTYSGWGEKTFAIFAKRTNCERYVIEQFINKTDKNGIKIYEGDKLKNNTYTFIVYWDKNSLSFKLKNDEPGWVYDITSFIDTLVIVGNIHID